MTRHMTARSVTIITPCLNAQHLIRRTVESIRAQTAVRSGRVRLQYLVCDGGSRDGTLNVVRELLGTKADIRSAPDASMYDALAVGLRRADGDVIGYLNAGDTYDAAALDIVADVLDGRSPWITGRIVNQDEDGTVLMDALPFRYRRDLLVKRLYGTAWLPFFVQQESTFFARSLLEHVDLAALSRYRLAGDAFLWSSLARAAELVVVDARLGAFTVHAGQKSEDLEGYRKEMVHGAPRSARDYAAAVAERALWNAPPFVRRRLAPAVRRAPTHARVTP
jgi:glycosyltransferase involved in cell wall biosynthesis